MDTQLEYYIATKKELDNIFKTIGNYSGISLKDVYGAKPSSKQYKMGIGFWDVRFEVNDNEQYNQFINQIYNQL